MSETPGQPGRDYREGVLREVLSLFLIFLGAGGVATALISLAGLWGCVIVASVMISAAGVVVGRYEPRPPEFRRPSQVADSDAMEVRPRTPEDGPAHHA